MILQMAQLSSYYCFNVYYHGLNLLEQMASGTLHHVYPVPASTISAPSSTSSSSSSSSEKGKESEKDKDKYNGPVIDFEWVPHDCQILFANLSEDRKGYTTNFVIMQSPSCKVVFVIFRGSENINDWLVNFNALPAPFYVRFLTFFPL